MATTSALSPQFSAHRGSGEPANVELSPDVDADRTVGTVTVFYLKGDFMTLISSPMLADAIWIGGGTLGLILLIVVIVLVLRR